MNASSESGLWATVISFTSGMTDVGMNTRLLSDSDMNVCYALRRFQSEAALTAIATFKTSPGRNGSMAKVMACDKPERVMTANHETPNVNRMASAAKAA